MSNFLKNAPFQYPFKMAGISLLLSGLITLPTQAMQELADESLSRVNAQQGLFVETGFSGATFDRFYWEDSTGTPNSATERNLRGYAENLSISGADLGSSLKLDFGATAGGAAGVNLEFASNLGTLAGTGFRICEQNGTTCGMSLGSLTLQTSAASPTYIKLRTSDGLLNQNARGELELGIRNITQYLTQKEGTNKNNQLIAKDFNFNFTGIGYIWVDGSLSRGLVMETRAAAPATYHIDLARVSDSEYTSKTKPGLNLEFLYKNNVADNIYTLSNARGGLRVGASGRMTDAYLIFRGVDASGLPSDVLGKSYAAGGSAGTSTVLGNTGFAMRFKASFTRDDDGNGLDDTTGSNNPVELELAHAGTYAYGVSFGGLSPLQVRTGCTATSCSSNNTSLAYFDSGNIYLSLADTKRLQMPENTRLNATRLGTSYLTTSTDYSHLVHDGSISNPLALVLAVRNGDFQAISRRSRFIVSNDVTNTALLPTGAAAGGGWGIGLPFYNLNVNAALYGAQVGGAERFGAAFALSTQGMSTDGSKTTSILVIDGEPNTNDSNNPTNYYMGLRNIDMYMAGYGTAGLDGGRIKLDIGNFTLAIASQLAAGYLPGSKFKNTNRWAPSNSFTTNDDVLAGLNLKLAGSTTVELIPPGTLTGTDEQKMAQNYMSFEGTMTVTGGALQIVEPLDGTILGLDNLTGKLGFQNAIKINKDSVDFRYTLNINPDSNAVGVVRMKDVNMYPSGGAAQRLGEIVLTGGKLVSNLTLKPF